MFFDGWDDLGRVLVVGTLAYIGLVIMLRVTGKRTLSKMNAFDLVVTVALGSTLASTFLSQDVALVEGLFALALLCAMQFVVTYASIRSERFQHLVKAEPTLLLYRGQMIRSALRAERVTREEILAALRSSGIGDPSQAAAVVLETDGSLSVVPQSDHAQFGSLETARGIEAARAGI